MGTITLSLHEIRILKIALLDAMDVEEFPDKECGVELYERLKKVQYGIE